MNFNDIAAVGWARMKAAIAMFLCVGCATARGVDHEATTAGTLITTESVGTAASAGHVGVVELIDSDEAWALRAPAFHAPTHLPFDEKVVAVIDLGSTGTIRRVIDDGRTMLVHIEVSAQCGGANPAPRSEAVLLPRSNRPIRVELNHVGRCDRNDVP